MGLHKWIYKGRVKKHLVEVNHSPESGKLMIKLNGEMMLYDYGITSDANQDRNYFFIIDGALCSVNVFKKKDKRKYQYDFLEEEIMAGKRIASKQEKRKKQLYWLFGIIIFLLISVALLPFYKKLFSAPVSHILLNGAATMGTVSSFDTTGNTSINYTFYVNGKKYNGSSNELKIINGSEATPEGLPIEIGNQFEVRYNRDKFSDNLLILSKPEAELLADFKASVSKELKLKHNDLLVDDNKLNAYCNCLSETIFKNFGLKGLSLFYHNINIPEGSKGFERADFKLILLSPLYFSEEVECREDFLFPEF